MSNFKQLKFVGFTVAVLLAVIDHLSTSKQARANQAKAEALDELNGNLERLNLAEQNLSNLIIQWKEQTPDENLKIIIAVHHILANLVTITKGWHFLYQERQAVIKSHLGNG